MLTATTLLQSLSIICSMSLWFWVLRDITTSEKHHDKIKRESKSCLLGMTICISSFFWAFHQNGEYSLLSEITTSVTCLAGFFAHAFWEPREKSLWSSQLKRVGALIALSAFALTMISLTATAFILPTIFCIIIFNRHYQSINKFLEETLGELESLHQKIINLQVNIPSSVDPLPTTNQQVDKSVNDKSA